MQVTIEGAKDLAEVLRDEGQENSEGALMDEAAQTIEKLAAALNWALVAMNRKGDTCTIANIQALLDGSVPTDRAY